MRLETHAVVAMASSAGGHDTQPSVLLLAVIAAFSIMPTMRCSGDSFHWLHHGFHVHVDLVLTMWMLQRSQVITQIKLFGVRYCQSSHLPARHCVDRQKPTLHAPTDLHAIQSLGTLRPCVALRVLSS